MSIHIDTRSVSEDDWAAVPADIRRLAATLAWRRHAAEAVVPVLAQIEPPSAYALNYAPAPRYPLLNDHPSAAFRSICSQIPNTDTD